MGQGFDGGRVVTMKGVDIDRIHRHAPELDVFLGAVHPACDLVQVQPGPERPITLTLEDGVAKAS